MRKTATVTIDGEDRDRGKVFILTEMSAARAERWAMRAFLALAKSGVDVPEDVLAMGFAGIVVLGIRAFGGIGIEDADELMEEMMACIQFVPDPAKPQVMRNLIEDDIEEVKTRLYLRGEVLALHTNFSLKDALSNFRGALAENSTADIETTPTSPGPSGPSSQAA